MDLGGDGGVGCVAGDWEVKQWNFQWHHHL